MTETHIIREVENLSRRKHRVLQHIFFLESCQANEILPKFTVISRSVINKLQLKPPQILIHRRKLFYNALDEHKSNLQYYNQQLDICFRDLRYYNPYANKIFAITMSKIEKSEFFTDQKRSKKLNRLIEIKKLTQIETPTVTIINHTQICLPENIKKILSQGLTNPIGGFTNKKSIFTKFEMFFKEWRQHAENVNMNCFDINRVKSELYLTFEKFSNCSTQNNSYILKKFLDDRPFIIITPSDKSKNVTVFYLSDYMKKLDETFNADKFKKLRYNPINVDLKKYRAEANKMKPHISVKDERRIMPVEALKSAYGVPKNAKPGVPLRLIVSSLNCICTGAEAFLHDLIKPIVAECKFSIKSIRNSRIKF
jgi:hypothetical protein